MTRTSLFPAFLRVAAILTCICALLVGVVQGIGRGLPTGKGYMLTYRSTARGAGEIYLADFTRQIAADLTKNSANDYGMAWSPDGQSIAFISDRDGSDDIYVTDIWRGGTRNLTNNAFRNRAPSWSPDGQQIAFYIRWPTYAPELHIVNVATAEVRLLAQNVVETRAGPCWSADGSQIVVASFGGGAADLAELHLINVANGNVETVSEGGSALSTFTCLS